MLPLAKAPQADQTAQGEAFDAFRRDYNEVRPHEALGMDTPAEHYRPSHATNAGAPARARLSGRGGGAPRAPQRRDQMERRPRLRLGDAGRRSRSPSRKPRHGEWALSFYAHPLGIIDTKHMRLVRRSAAPNRPRGAAADVETGGKPSWFDKLTMRAIEKPLKHDHEL